MSSATTSDFIPLKGHCVCRTLTYTLLAQPLITHCCHCSYCQQETGSAFALNTVIECYNFKITSSDQPAFANRPSPSSPDGSKHIVAHCPNPSCNVDIFSYYGGNRATVYVKFGSLDEQSRKRVRPDVHIFTSSKVEWVELGAEVERGVKVCDEFYNMEDVWTKKSLERLGKLKEWKIKQEEEGKAI